jgi:hypothetical protein
MPARRRRSGTAGFGCRANRWAMSHRHANCANQLKFRLGSGRPVASRRGSSTHTSPLVKSRRHARPLRERRCGSESPPASGYSA